MSVIDDFAKGENFLTQSQAILSSSLTYSKSSENRVNSKQIEQEFENFQNLHETSSDEGVLFDERNVFEFLKSILEVYVRREVNQHVFLLVVCGSSQEELLFGDFFCDFFFGENFPRVGENRFFDFLGENDVAHFVELSFFGFLRENSSSDHRVKRNGQRVLFNVEKVFVSLLFEKTHTLQEF